MHSHYSLEQEKGVFELHRLLKQKYVALLLFMHLMVGFDIEAMLYYDLDCWDLFYEIEEAWRTLCYGSVGYIRDDLIERRLYIIKGEI